LPPPANVWKQAARSSPNRYFRSLLLSCQSLNPVLRSNPPSRIPNLRPNLYDPACSRDRFRFGLHRERTSAGTRSPRISSRFPDPYNCSSLATSRANNRCNLAGTLARQNCQLPKTAGYCPNLPASVQSRREGCPDSTVSLNERGCLVLECGVAYFKRRICNHCPAPSPLFLRHPLTQS
jgi:hypothetical protein